MSFRQSIRWRIQIWHGALLLTLCVGFGITAYRLEKSKAMEHVDRELELRLNSLVIGLARGGHPPPPPPRRPRGDYDEEEAPPPEDYDRLMDDLLEEEERPPPPELGSPDLVALFTPGEAGNFYYQLWDRSDRFLTKSESAPGRIPMPASKEDGGLDKATATRSGFREAYVYTPPGECFLTGISLVGFEKSMARTAWKITAIGAAILAFGLAIGWWIATRALRPIADISSAAARIAAGNFHERIRTGDTESELGKLASVLDDTFQRLDSAFEEQARFTSDAAHELRTPVSVILAQSQLALSKDRGAEEYRETIEISQRAAKRMHGLIEALLQLAVLDAEGEELDRESCDLAEVAREQVALISPLAAEKSITLIEDLSPCGCKVNGDQISRIVSNLLENAVKYCPVGSAVQIHAAPADDAVVLSVRDNGPGIASRHLPHLFERFYRVETSRNRATGGAGLGLSICHRIAAAHGGSLDVRSIEGAGTEFILTLPDRRRSNERG